MKRKLYCVRLEEEIINNFRRQAELDEVSQQDIITMLMSAYISGDFKIVKPKPILKYKPK